MSQHYSTNTIAVPRNCNKCRRRTQHRVNPNHTLGHCLVCLYQLDPKILSADELKVWDIGLTPEERAKAMKPRPSRPAVAVQEEMFA